MAKASGGGEKFRIIAQSKKYYISNFATNRQGA